MPLDKIKNFEKDALIRHYREQLILKDSKIETLETNIKSTLMQSRELENKMNAMENHYIHRLDFITESIKNSYKATILATKGEI